jgi:hypothetical protein
MTKILFKAQSTYFIKQLMERLYFDKMIVKIEDKIYNYNKAI